eukprot:gene7140-11453_t
MDKNQNQESQFSTINKYYLEKMKLKYNFDFEAEKPLPGKFEWEKVIKPKSKFKSENVATELASLGGVRRRGGKDGIKLFSDPEIPDPYDNKEKPLFTTTKPNGFFSTKIIAIIVIILLIISAGGLFMYKEVAKKKYNQMFSKPAEVQVETNTQTTIPTEQKKEPVVLKNDEDIKITDVKFTKPKTKKPKKPKKRYEDDEDDDDEEEEREERERIKRRKEKEASKKKEIERKHRQKEEKLKQLQQEIEKKKKLHEKKEKKLEELAKKLKQKEDQIQKKKETMPPSSKINTEAIKETDSKKQVDDLIDEKKIEAEEAKIKQQRNEQKKHFKKMKKVFKKLNSYERYLVREPKINVKDRRLNDLKREEFRLKRVKEMKEFQIQKLKELSNKPKPAKIEQAYKKKIEDQVIPLMIKEPRRFVMERIDVKNIMFKHIIDDYFEGKVQKGCPLLYFSSNHDLNLPLETSHSMLIKHKKKLLSNIMPDSYILPLAYLGIISKIIWVKTNVSSVIQPGKYEFEIGNIESTDKLGVNSKDLFEFFTSYSPNLTNKKKIYLEVVDIDKWNLEDTNVYEKLITVPGDVGSPKPPLLFYNADFLYYKNAALFPMKKLKVKNSNYYTKWKFPSSYNIQTSNDSRDIRRFFDKIFLAERMFKKVNIQKLSKPIWKLWKEGEIKAQEYFKSLDELIRKELIGLTILTKGNLPMFNYSLERRTQLINRSIQFIDRLYSSKFLSLTKNQPRRPFYSAMYSKPDVPPGIYRYVLKTLHRVFKSRALDDRPEMKIKNRKMTKKEKNHRRAERHHSNHVSPPTHDDIDHRHHVPPPPPPPAGKPKYHKPKSNGYDDDEEDDDDDDDE